MSECGHLSISCDTCDPKGSPCFHCQNTPKAPEPDQQVKIQDPPTSAVVSSQPPPAPVHLHFNYNKFDFRPSHSYPSVVGELSNPDYLNIEAVNTSTVRAKRSVETHILSGMDNLSLHEQDSSLSSQSTPLNESDQLSPIPIISDGSPQFGSLEAGQNGVDFSKIQNSCPPSSPLGMHSTSWERVTSNFVGLGMAENELGIGAFASVYKVLTTCPLSDYRFMTRRTEYCPEVFSS